MDKEKKNSKRLWIILAIVVFALLAVVAVLIVLLVNRNGSNSVDPQNGFIENSEVADKRELAYDTSVVATDPETLQQMFDELVEKAKEGTMALEMKTDAFSDDGTNFSCYVANAVSNQYDMFVVIYLDETQEEVYRSGLIPVGSRLETFTTTVRIDPGTHVGTIVYNQVEDDHSTIHAQVNIGLNLIVK